MEMYMWVCPKCGNIKAGWEDDICRKCGHSVILTGTSFDEFTSMNAVQEQEWHKQVTEKYVKSSPEFSEEAMDKRFEIEFKESYAEQHKPKCPTCGSTKIQKIGGIERGVSVGMFGILSKKINKSFKSGHCGYTW